MFELASEIGYQEVRLDLARSVLAEVMRRFEAKIQPGSYEALYLVQSTEHVYNLLNVVDEYVLDTAKKLGECSQHIIALNNETRSA